MLKAVETKYLSESSSLSINSHLNRLFKGKKKLKQEMVTVGVSEAEVIWSHEPHI